MRILIFVLSIFLSIGTASANSEKKIAMVFDGGGFDTAMFLGMLKGVEDAGLKPNVVIGTCGGSIAAAITHVIERPDEQLEFVKSKEFYNLLTSVNFTKYRSIPKMLMLVQNFYLKYTWRRIIPDLFNDYLMNVPLIINLENLAVDFTPRDHQTVIIAAKILYTKERVGQIRKKGEKLFQQTIFTDSLTAEELKGFIAPGSRYKNSSVAPQVQFITDANLNEAARASISDEFYMAPGEFKGDRFITGAIDLYPFELAKRLADKVIFIRQAPFDFIDQGATSATFNYNENDRSNYVFHQKIDYLIDATDYPSALVLEPAPDFRSGKMKSKVPARYEDYLEIVKKQYEYGQKKATEAAKKWTI